MKLYFQALLRTYIDVLTKVSNYVQGRVSAILRVLQHPS